MSYLLTIFDNDKQKEVNIDVIRNTYKNEIEKKGEFFISELISQITPEKIGKEPFPLNFDNEKVFKERMLQWLEKQENTIKPFTREIIAKEFNRTTSFLDTLSQSTDSDNKEFGNFILNEIYEKYILYFFKKINTYYLEGKLRENLFFENLKKDTMQTAKKIIKQIEEDSKRDYFATAMKAARIKEDISIRDLETTTGIQRSELSRLENKKRGLFKADKLKLIADALNMDLNEIYEVLGIMDITEENTVKQILEALNPEEMVDMLDWYIEKKSAIAFKNKNDEKLQEKIEKLETLKEKLLVKE